MLNPRKMIWCVLCLESALLLPLYVCLDLLRLSRKLRLLNQGILKGEVSLYCWPPVWLVWNQLSAYRQFLFLFAKQANPNQSNRRSTVQWYFPLQYSLTKPSTCILNQGKTALVMHHKRSTHVCWLLVCQSIQLDKAVLISCTRCAV